MMANLSPSSCLRASWQGGVTLLEILIVLMIILVLASFMIVGLDIIEDRRSRLVTSQRMDHVLNRLAQIGMGASGSVVYELQTAIPDLGGTRRFERGMGVDAAPYVLPEDRSGDGSPDPWHHVFPHSDAVSYGNPVVSGADDRPLIMAYPWGQERKYRIGTWQGDDGDDAYYWDLYEQHVNNDEDFAYPAAERHRLHELWPRRSAQLLSYLGVVSDVETYHGNRSPKQAWNDAWGHPLIVAYALYQPPKYRGTNQSRHPDYYLQRAQDLYQYNRSIYVSIGAAGPDISPYAFVADWNINMTALWNHICDIAMPDEETTWNERSFHRNPWSGTRIASDESGERQVFLSAPVEFR
ncbi:MAG: prepilin-type N-terminal cleavage/methylation domain-containing protein [Planctomycetota bacterium]|nr:MAG: prepilin-type N-terminal cleavage/methylation domain-containing protein [Planctomycetota bacterium]